MPVRPPIPELLKFLSAYDKPVIALAIALRKKVLTADWLTNAVTPQSVDLSDGAE
jgi:hypothetical protein